MVQFLMSIDVVDLRDFYSNRLGAVARHFVGRGVRRRWTNTRELRVLGIGYATPYLGLFREEAERCLAFMPAAQGVVKWPTHRAGLAALVDGLDLPLPDSAGARIRRTAAAGRPEPPRGLGTPGYDAIRARPAVLARADHPLVTRGLVHS